MFVADFFFFFLLHSTTTMHACVQTVAFEPVVCAMKVEMQPTSNQSQNNLFEKLFISLFPATLLICTFSQVTFFPSQYAFSARHCYTLQPYTFTIHIPPYIYIIDAGKNCVVNFERMQKDSVFVRVCGG